GAKRNIASPALLSSNRDIIHLFIVAAVASRTRVWSPYWPEIVDSLSRKSPKKPRASRLCVCAPRQRVSVHTIWAANQLHGLHRRRLAQSSWMSVAATSVDEKPMRAPFKLLCAVALTFAFASLMYAADEPDKREAPRPRLQVINGSAETVDVFWLETPD